MNERLIRLETHFEYIQKDLSEIKANLGATLSRLNELPTRGELNSWKWQWIGMSIAVIALALAGVVGGLALINRSVDVPAPQVIVVPQAATQPPAAR